MCLCLRGLLYQAILPTSPSSNLIIQFIEFAYYNDQFSIDKLKAKTNKHLPLLNNIRLKGWQVAFHIVITARACATIYIFTLKSSKTPTKFNSFKSNIHT